MSDVTVNILLKANDQALPTVQGLSRAIGGLQNTAAGGARGRGIGGGFLNASHLTTAASGVQQLTHMARGAIAAPIELAANFEAAINRVDAFSGSTLSLQGNLSKVEAESRRLGGSTEFTATQVADGFAILTQAGFTYEQQMASIATVVNFATAGQVDMAKAAEVLGGTLGSFGVDAANAADFADVLAKVSTKTGTDINKIGQSMKDVGPIAATLGLDVRQTAAAVGVLGKSFINGGRAGKALRSILADIDPTKKIGRKVISHLGIKSQDLTAAVDSGDVSAPFRLIDQALQKKGLEGAQREKAVKLLFGKNRMAEAELLLRATRGGTDDERSFAFFQQQTEDTAGALNLMAERMRSGLKGSTKELTSALEEMAITIGQELNPVLLPLIEDAKELTHDFAEWAKKNPDVVQGLGKLLLGVVGVGTVLAPVLLAMSSFVSLASVGAGAVAGLGGTMSLSLGPYVLLAAAAAGLGLEIADLVDDMGRLNVEQETLNELQRQGLSLQIGLAKVRGAALLGDLTEDERTKLDALQKRKGQLAEELQNVSSAKELLFGSSASFLGMQIGDRGSFAIQQELASVEKQIGAINTSGMQRGQARVAQLAGESSLSPGSPDAATAQQVRDEVTRARAAIDALQTNREMVDVGGAIEIHVSQDKPPRVSKIREGAVPVNVSAGPTLEGG